jgi:TldD protein
MASGLATVKWDDEGVVPETFSLVQDGMLVDFSTVREHANWLGKWYTSRRQPVRSHGCAAAASAMDTVHSVTPNLTLAPSRETAGFDELVASTKRGIALIGGFALMDFQSRGGMCMGDFREIVDGKLGARLGGAGMLFDSMGLWKNLVALGGAASQERFSGSESKGQPTQYFFRSIAAVPGVFKGMAVVDQGKHVL